MSAQLTLDQAGNERAAAVTISAVPLIRRVEKNKKGANFKQAVMTAIK